MDSVVAAPRRAVSRLALVLTVITGVGGASHAALVVDDSLNRYSLFGRKGISIDDRANTAKGGWVGSDGVITAEGDDTISSTVTTKDLVIQGNGNTRVVGHTDVRGYLSIRGDLITFDSLVQVRDSVRLWYRDSFKLGLNVLNGAFRLPEWARNNHITWANDNYASGTTPDPGLVTTYTKGTAFGRLNWVNTMSHHVYGLPFPDTTIPAAGSLNIGGSGSAFQNTTWKCASNTTYGGSALPASACLNDSTLAPGTYGNLELTYGSRLYLSEGVYTFNSIKMECGTTPAYPTLLLASQPTGLRTVIMTRNGLTLGNTAGSARTIIAPAAAVNFKTGNPVSKKYGTSTSADEFAGGSLLIYSGAGWELKNYLDLWATAIAPTGTLELWQSVRLFGQLFADSIAIHNDFKGTDGAFIPYFPKPPVITVGTLGARVTEGNPPALVYAKFPITMDHINGLGVVVYFHTETVGKGYTYADSTKDYFHVSQDSIIIRPTFLSDTIRVRIRTDLSFEPTDTFRLVLDSSRYGSLGSNKTGFGIIEDDDPPPMFSFVSAASSDSEKVSKPLITVKLSLPQTDTVKVNVVDSSKGTATAGGDYTFATETLVFLPGQILDTVGNLSIVADALHENAETVALHLVNPVGGLIDVSGTGIRTHVHTILDDDAPPMIASLVALDSAEGNTGAKTWRFKAILSAKSGLPVTFTWSTVNGTVPDRSALAGEDYLGVVNRSVTIPAGSDTALLEVDVSGDTKFENDESFGISVVPVSGITAAGSILSTTGTINNDDSAPSILSIDGVSEFEGDAGTKVFTFKLRTSAVSGLPATFTWSAVGGVGLDSAKLGEDFLAVAIPSITIPPGSDSAELEITVLGDTKYERDEVFFVVAVPRNGMGGAPDTAVGLIRNDDSPPVVRILDAADVTEPAVYGDVVNATFKIALSARTGVPVDVTWATADSSARQDLDYTRSGGVATFAQDVQDTIVVTVPVLGDSLHEWTESFWATIMGAPGASIAEDSALARILDNDAAPALHVDDATISEPATGTDVVSVRVWLERPSARPVSFRWSTRDSTARSGAGDYDSTGESLRTIAAYETSTDLSVTVNSDAMSNEFQETFRVAVGEVVNASGPDTSGVVQIVDRPDQPHISIDPAGNVVEDPVHLLFPIRIDRISAVAMRVRWRTVEGSAKADLDYKDTSGTLEIPAGATFDTLRVRILEDGLYEPRIESLQVVLSDPEYLVISNDRAPGGIIDDNDAPPVVIDSSNPVVEGGSALVPVRLLGISSDTVFVHWRTLDGSATAPGDFEAASGTLVFLPGDSLRMVAVATTVDNIWEPSESLWVKIDSVRGGFVAQGEDSLGMVRLLEEGAFPTVSFGMNDTAVVEGLAGKVPVKVVLSRGASIPLSIGILVDKATVATRGEDYQLESLRGDTLFIPALATSVQFENAVLDDSLDEIDELVRLGFQVLDRLAVQGKSALEILILDDDSAPDVRFATDSQFVDESVGKVTVTAALSRPSSKSIDVWYSVQGTATADGVDHDLRSFRFHFDPGATTATIEFNVNDDVIDEPDETVVVRLDSAVNGNLSQPAQHVVVIRDNDASPRARFLDTLKTVREDVGTVGFPIVIDRPSSQDIVLLVTVKGTAILDSLHAGSDVVLDSTVEYRIVIRAGDTTATFTIPVIGDGRVEQTENVILTLRGGAGADPSATSISRLEILDDDRAPDVRITRPADSLRTNKPEQVIAWAWDLRDQPTTDTILVEGWNRITRCATDTAGNTGCDTVHVWGDFTPPAITITKPDSVHLTNKPNVQICWTVIDSGATWRRVDNPCMDTTLTEGTHTIERVACDSVGNCARDQVVVTVDLTPPTGMFIHPPDSAHIRVRDQPARLRWIDGDDTIYVADTLHMTRYGWNTFTATYTDKAGNVGSTTVSVYYEVPKVEGGWYLDTDGDGKVDAAVVEFDSPWLSDTLPTFSLELGSQTRDSLTLTGAKDCWYTGGSRGVPAVDSRGDVVLDAKGDTIYLAPGIAMTDKNGKPVIDSATGKVVTSPVGGLYRDASGKAVYDAQGREMYRVTGPGEKDRTRMVVSLGTNPFAYGVTSVSPGDSGSLKVDLSVFDSTGSSVSTRFEARFPLADSVAPIIVKAVVERTESYTGKDNVYITPSEPIVLDSNETWIEVKVDGVWHVVPADSVKILPDGRILILVEPGEDGSVRPGLEVRFGSGVSDSLGNGASPSETKWTTKVEGDPRPPLLELELPEAVKTVPASEKTTTRDGGFVIRATNKDDPSGYQWWKPGSGYTNGADPEIREVCPDISYCTGIELYVNRPVRMFLYIYDLAGVHVIDDEINLTKEDIESLKADKLDRVRVQFQWNMRSKDGRIVGSGIYLWRVVSYVQDPNSNKPYMTNEVIRLGVKSALD